MRKSLLMLLLLSTSAAAEWTFVGDGEALKIYVDRSSVVENGSVVRMWALVDYATVQQWSDYLSYRSLKTHRAFDCSGARQHTQSSLLHREQMGSGESVYAVPVGSSWQPVTAGSIDEVLWNFACKP